MTRQEFEEALPQEFGRSLDRVMARIARERNEHRRVFGWGKVYTDEEIVETFNRPRTGEKL